MSERGGTWICAIDNEVEMEKNSQRELQRSFRFDNYQCIDGCNVEGKTIQRCKCCLSTSFGTIPIYQLMSECFNTNGGNCKSHKPGMVGSIISIFYDVESVRELTHQENLCLLQTPDSIGSSGISELPILPSHTTKSFDWICFKYTFHVLINGVEVNAHEDLVYIIPPTNELFTSANPYDYLPQVRAVVDVYGSTKSVQIMNFEQNKVKSLQDMCVHEMIKTCGYEHLSQLPNSLKNYLQIQLHKLLHIK